MMKRRKLTDEVSVEEMLKMREAGMTNQDIADSLDTTVCTVRRYIGLQPGSRRRPDAAPGIDRAGKADAKIYAALTVTNRTLDLAGAVAEYSIDTKSGKVLFQVKGIDACMEISFEQWPDFCLEVQGIERHLKEIIKPGGYGR